VGWAAGDYRFALPTPPRRHEHRQQIADRSQPTHTRLAVDRYRRRPGARQARRGRDASVFRERMVTSLDSARLQGDHPRKAPAASQKQGQRNAESHATSDIRAGRCPPGHGNGPDHAGHGTSASYDAEDRVQGGREQFRWPVALVAAVPISNIPSGRQPRTLLARSACSWQRRRPRA
jgi:hypothetical protein